MEFIRFVGYLYIIINITKEVDFHSNNILIFDNMTSWVFFFTIQNMTHGTMFWDLLKNIVKRPSKHQVECQAPKAGNILFYFYNSAYKS